MKTTLKKISTLILSVILVCFVLPVSADASYEIPRTCQVQTDTGVAYTVKTLDYSYDHNTYLSLRDIAVALNGTEKSFSLAITKNTVALNLGGILHIILKSTQRLASFIYFKSSSIHSSKEILFLPLHCQ